MKARLWRAGRYVIRDDDAGIWTLSRAQVATLRRLPRAWPDGRYGLTETDIIATAEQVAERIARMEEPSA